MPKRKTTTSQPSSPKRQKHQPAHDVSAEGPDTPGVPDVPDAPAVLPSPACPGQVRLRETGPLSPIVPESEIVEVFSKLREDKELSNEQALLEFLTKFNVSATTLSKAITEKRLDVSFSRATFQEVAPYVWLDPLLGDQDILHLDIFRSRIPNDDFQEICEDVDKATRLYGPIHTHENEEARSRFIASLFTTIVSLFGGCVINKPEGLLEGDFTRDGRIEHHFLALDAISIVFIEVKRTLAMGKQRLDTKAQVLAECAACDQLNQKQGFGVPILAILCDGLNLEYLVYDASEKQVYSSGLTIGITANEVGGSTELLISLKKTTEYLMDWFLMGYLNAIRAFWSKSSSTDTETQKKTPFD